MNNCKCDLSNLDPNNLPDCPIVWDLFASGNTKGIWQLETQLGQNWCKKLKPENINHLGGLVAALRPGVLQCYDENKKSFTAKYCDRKNGIEEIEYKYPIIKSYLKNTFDILLFQEQMIKISETIADFSLAEQGDLRKSVSKKNQDALAKIGKIFIDKATTKGLISREEAENIFELFRKSGRYLFCKAHAIAYGIKTYNTAYIKSHFPTSFYASWLLNAHSDSDPREEIRELVEDAKKFSINIECPDILSLEPNITIYDNNVRFGLADIKGVGPKQVEKLKESLNGLSLNKWEDFLFYCSDKPNKTSINNWIATGALKFTKLSRNRMLKEYECWSQLTNLEKKWIRENCKNLSFSEAIKLAGKTKKDGGACNGQKRAEVVQSLGILLDNQASSDNDHPNQIVEMEENYLGVAISCNRVDACDITAVTTTCKEFGDGKKGTCTLGVEIKEIKELKIKSGNNEGKIYARGMVSDGTLIIPFVVWSEEFEKNKNILKTKNTVLIEGHRDKFDSLTIKKVYQL